jgi:EmrB/QacA subfamily drug resistance transporter
MAEAAAGGDRISMPAEAGETFCPPEARPYVLAATILASAMGFIDGSVVAIAVPAIRADLGASLADVQWVSNGYMLFMASLILIGGAAGDRFGLRRVFSGGIGLFVVASLACALAPSPPLLILFRAVQGLGAAFMVPGSLALIAKAYPRDRRGWAIGIWATAATLTTILGPVAGGALLSALGNWSWRLVFAINLPFGLAALALLLWRVPPDPAAEGRRLDWFGGVLVTLALLLIAFGLTGEGGEAGAAVPDTTHIAIYCGVGLVLLLGFLLWEARTAFPMLPLGLFANRAFSGANGLTFALYFSLSAISFYLPMALIAGWGVTPALVSIALLPIGIFITVLSPVSGRWADRYGTARLIAGGAALVALSFAGLAVTTPLQSLWFAVLPMMALMGIGMGFVVTPLSTAVMTSVSDADTGTASGVNNAVARVAGLLAVATMGGVAALVFVQAAGPQGAALSFGRPPEAALPAGIEALRVAATDAGFSAVAWITAVLSALSAVIAWTTLEHKGKAAIGTRQSAVGEGDGR